MSLQKYLRKLRKKRQDSAQWGGVHDLTQFSLGKIVQWSQIKDLDLRGVSLDDITIENSTIDGVDFGELEVALMGARFKDVVIKNCSFEGMELWGIKFIDAKILDTNFNGCSFYSDEYDISSLFNDVELINVTFRGADLRNCKFDAGNVDHIDLSHLDIRFENEAPSSRDYNYYENKYSLLYDIDFRDANIESASFSNCDFMNVNFKRVNMENTFFDEIHFDDKTYKTLDPGQNLPESFKNLPLGVEVPNARVLLAAPVIDIDNNMRLPSEHRRFMVGIDPAKRTSYEGLPASGPPAIARIITPDDNRHFHSPNNSADRDINIVSVDRNSYPLQNAIPVMHSDEIKDHMKKYHARNKIVRNMKNFTRRQRQRRESARNKIVRNLKNFTRRQRQRREKERRISAAKSMADISATAAAAAAAARAQSSSRPAANIRDMFPKKGETYKNKKDKKNILQRMTNMFTRKNN